MAKVIVVANIKDPVKWEQGFRTHGDLFRSQTVRKPVSYGIADGSQVAVCFEPDDLSASMNVLNSPATAEAMDFDGVLRDTVKIFVLDKEVAV